MSRRYASRRHAGGLGPSRVRTRILTTRRLGQWVLLHKTLRFRVRLQLDFFNFPRSVSPFLPCILFSRRRFSRPTPRRPVHLPSPGRVWCLLTGSSPSSRFPRRCCTVLYCTVLYCTVLFASFDVMAVGTNSLSCGFNWQCTADMSLAICRYDHSTPGLLTVSSVTSTVWVHPGREAAGVEV